MRLLLTVCWFSLAMPLVAQLRITEICPRPDAADPNGRESGWVELTNTSPTETVNLKDYKLMRFNRGKKIDAKKFTGLCDRAVAPGARTLVYTSETYDNAEDLGGDGKTVKVYDNDVMVVPAKVNPKKYPYLVLTTAAGEIVDDFIVPVDLPDNQSFGPGAAQISTTLLGSDSLYSYRVAGETDWHTDAGKGRIAGVLSAEPRDAAGRLETDLTFDTSALSHVTVTDGNGVARNDAYDFSGSGGCTFGATLPVSVTEQLAGAGVYTVSFWFRSGQSPDRTSVNTANVGMPLFDCRPSGGDNRSGMIVFLNDDGQITVQPRNAAGTSTTLYSDTDASYDDGTWHHLVLVAGQQVGDPVRLWLDGANEIDAILSVAPALQSGIPLCFGRAYNSSSWHTYNGHLADVRVYPRALTNDEAAVLMDEAPSARKVYDAGNLTVDTTLLMQGQTVTDGQGTTRANVFTVNATSGVKDRSIAAEMQSDGNAAKFVAGATYDFWFCQTALATTGHEGTPLVDTRVDGKGFILVCSDDGTLKVQGLVGNNFLVSTEAVPLNTWAHVTLTVNETLFTLFLNGRQIGQATYTEYVRLENAAIRFVCTHDANGFWRPFRGSIGDIAIYSGAMVAREVAKLHNAATTGADKVLETGEAAGAQTVVSMPGGYAALEAKTTLQWNTPGPNDRLRFSAESVGTLSVTFNGQPVTIGVDFPVPSGTGGGNSFDLAWRVEPAADGVAAQLTVEYLRATEGVTRVIMPELTPGVLNNLSGAVEYGPNVGPLYGVSHKLSDWTACAPIPVATDFTVTLPVNPLSADAANAIVSVRLLYRADFGEIKSVLMTKGANETNGTGQNWIGVIPAADIPAAGHLLRWAADITDGSGKIWRSPSFCNPDDGYEWYGTLVQPTTEQTSKTLQTFHLFADATALSLMDKQYDAVAGKSPHGARVGIYDTQTALYYDNVRIDLRGNTTANFNKKSHGLRFNKCQPLGCVNPFDGEELETRKTSFIAEYADPSFIRQSLSFWIFRKAGNLVPFDYPVRLQMNGAFYQLAFHSNRFTDELIEDYYGLAEKDGRVGYGYKNVGTFSPSGGTSAGGIEKKTPDDGDETSPAALKPLTDFTKTLTAAASVTESADPVVENVALTKTVVKCFDLPAWLNYLATARLTQEADDVWANLSAYWDITRTGTWMPLAYDHNLSFGQWYYGDDMGTGRVGLRPVDDTFKSHPFYGGFRVRAHKSGGVTVGNGNYAVEAIWQSEKFRRLYLRRLRTLMDEVLKAPGTAKEQTDFWQYAETLRTAIAADAELDRVKWDYTTKATGTVIYVWDRALTLDEGFTDLWDNYVVPRRTHLFVTHAATSAARTVGYGKDLIAGIPETQTATSELAAGFSFDNAYNTDGLTSGFTDTEKLVIRNANAVAVDMSGWAFSGAVQWTLPPGTVVDANDTLTVVANRSAYVAAHTSDLVNQVIVGNAAFVEASRITLSDAAGVPVTSVSWMPPTNESRYLRIAEVMSNTPDSDGDGNEYIVLTNSSDTLTLNLEGVSLRSKKSGELSWSIDIVLPAETLVPKATVKLTKSAYWPGGKLTNNKVDMELDDGDGVRCQTLHVEAKWWPSTYGGGAALVAQTLGASLTEKNDWRPSFELPVDVTEAAAVIAAITARSEIGAWLGEVSGTEAGKTALAGFTGSSADLDTCWLVDILPQAAPAVELKVAAMSFDANGDLVIDGALDVNGNDKTGTVNGAVILQKFETLDGAPVEEILAERTFPLNLRTATGSARFFRLRLE